MDLREHMHGVGLALIGGFGEQLFCLLGIGLQVAETKEIPFAQLLLGAGAAGFGFGGEGFEIQGRKGCIGGLCGAQTGIGALPGKLILKIFFGCNHDFLQNSAQAGYL